MTARKAKAEEREPLDDDLQVGRATILIGRFKRVENGVVIGTEVKKGHGIVMLALGGVDFSKKTNFSADEVMRSLGWEYVGDKKRAHRKAEK